MAHFPVSNSNLSAQHLGIFIRDQYEFEGPVKCRLLRAGLNDTYAVSTDTDKYVFRVYSLDWRSKNEIQEEINLLLLLRENGLSVSYPVPSGSKFIMSLNAPEGERFGVLFSFAQGEKKQDYPLEMHFKIGELMASMHQLTDMIEIKRVTYTPEVMLTEPLTLIREFLSEGSVELQLMEKTQAYLLKTLKQVSIPDLRKGVVHLDIWFDNLNIDGDEITLFDFDFCGNGWLALDIAYYVMQVFYLEKDKAKYQAKVDSFLKGYASIAAISDEEKRILPMLGISLYFFYLVVQCRRYDNWSNIFLSENYLKRYINAIIKPYMELHGLDKAIGLK